MAKEEQELEKQEPEKPSGKQKGLKMPVIIGIIAGVLLVQVVIVYALFKSMAAPAHTEDGAKPKQETVKPKQNDELSEEEEFAEEEKLVKFYETGRITTNPKASSQFVIVNLGLVYRFKNEEAIKEAGEEAGLPVKSTARIKGIVNSVLGNFTADELLGRRDSLAHYFKDNLKPVFRENKLFLKEVILQEFIVQ